MNLSENITWTDILTFVLVFSAIVFYIYYLITKSTSQKPLTHVSWFKPDSSVNLKTSDGKDVTVINFEHDVSNSKALSQWAKHYRNHYCLDAELDIECDGTGLNKKDFLLKMVFPDPTDEWGMTVLPGDFTEFLVADYFEYHLEYWIPREKYQFKLNRNRSEQGTDILCLKTIDPGANSPDDELLLIEVKGNYSGVDNGLLISAIKESEMDYKRYGMTLQRLKRVYNKRRESDLARKIRRFQNLTDNPFNLLYSGVAFLDKSYFRDNVILKADSTAHKFANNLSLYVFQGEKMSELVKTLYLRAADEA